MESGKRTRNGTTALPICDVELIAELPRNCEGYPENPQTISDFLRKKRIDEGLTKGEICEALEIDYRTLKRWEESWIQPRLDNRRKLLDYLGC